MKVVVIFALVVAVLEAKPLRLKRDATDADVQIALDCIQELKLDRAKTLATVRLTTAPEDDEDHIKFMECTYSKKGYFNQDRTVNLHAVRQMIIDIYEEDYSLEYSEQVADTILHDCRDFHETGGLGAIKVGNCVTKNLKLIP